MSGITDSVEVSQHYVVIGQNLEATFIVDNPDEPINLTKLAREDFHQSDGKTVARLSGCEPSLGIILVGSRARQEISFTTDCGPAPFMIPHGTTRFPFSVPTSYTACAQQDGEASKMDPACTPQGPPPLPAGKYWTDLVWSEIVPLPKPTPVRVTLGKVTTAVPRTPGLTLGTGLAKAVSPLR